MQSLLEYGADASVVRTDGSENGQSQQPSPAAHNDVDELVIAGNVPMILLAIKDWRKCWRYDKLMCCIWGCKLRLREGRAFTQDVDAALIRESPIPSTLENNENRQNANPTCRRSLWRAWNLIDNWTSRKPYFPRWVSIHTHHTRKGNNLLPAPPSRQCTSSQSHCQLQSRLRSQNRRLHYTSTLLLDECWWIRTNEVRFVRFLLSPPPEESMGDRVDSYAKGRRSKSGQPIQKLRNRTLEAPMAGVESSYSGWGCNLCRTRRKGWIWTRFWMLTRTTGHLRYGNVLDFRWSLTNLQELRRVKQQLAAVDVETT